MSATVSNVILLSFQILSLTVETLTPWGTDYTFPPTPIIRKNCLNVKNDKTGHARPNQVRFEVTE